MMMIPAAVSADGNAGMIYGRVVNSDTGKPVAPITIHVYSSSEGPWVTQTKSDGSFVFLQVRPGPVSIVVGDGKATRFATISANLPDKEMFFLTSEQTATTTNPH